MSRIGVFICHCGVNIAGSVDIKKVVEEIGKYPGVELCVDYIYMCSDPGQAIVRDAICENKLDGVIVAACSPTLHETTFRKAVDSVGLNPYQFENANIREQCSWVHRDGEVATSKAIKIIQSMVEKVKSNESLTPIEVPLTKRALVIGAGISGMQSALDIANSGYEVILVEKKPCIGGHMAQLSETFPTLDCAQCILTPKTVEVGQHPNIKLLVNSEVEEVSGYVGNFKVTIKKNPTFVNWDKCTGCGLCAEACRLKGRIDHEFDVEMSRRGAIYVSFPQAVPLKYKIDKERCLYLTKGKCGKGPLCIEACEAEAIDFDQEEEHIEEDIGAIVVATGYDLYPIINIGEYGAGEIPDVINGLQFERILSASGPTTGEVKRPSDGAIPKEVVFIQCAGSRDPDKHLPYCSKICCMYTAKHAMLYKHKVPDGQAYIFYIDIRSAGKRYEEFVQRVIEEDDVLYLRGKVSKIFQEGEKVVVWGADTLTGEQVEIKADLVVLAMAVVPTEGTVEFAKKLKISTDEHGFLGEAHPKLRPVESLTAGMYLAGCAQAPKDIPETVSQASGAASKVLALFSGDMLYHEPVISFVDLEVCSGCGKCVSVCAYDAIELVGNNAYVNEALCEGCGACAATCPSGAIQHKNFTKKQIFDMIYAIGGD